MSESEVYEGKILLFPTHQINTSVEIHKHPQPQPRSHLLRKFLNYRSECKMGFTVTHDRGYDHLPVCHTPTGIGCNPNNCTYQLSKDPA